MTFWRFDVSMAIMKTPQKRATIYRDSGIRRALRIKTAETDRSVSELVNEAVKLRPAEDAEDLTAFEERAHGIRRGCRRIVESIEDQNSLVCLVKVGHRAHACRQGGPFLRCLG